MKIDYDSKQSFGKMRFSINAQKLLYNKRLKDGVDHIRYLNIQQSQVNNPHNILLTTSNSGRRFVARIKLNNKEMSPPIKENYLRALFSMSPLKFFERLCKIADSLD